MQAAALHVGEDRATQWQLRWCPHRLVPTGEIPEGTAGLWRLCCNDVDACTVAVGDATGSDWRGRSYTDVGAEAGSDGSRRRYTSDGHAQTFTSSFASNCASNIIYVHVMAAQTMSQTAECES